MPRIIMTIAISATFIALLVFLALAKTENDKWYAGLSQEEKAALEARIADMKGLSAPFGLKPTVAIIEYHNYQLALVTFATGDHIRLQHYVSDGKDVRLPIDWHLARNVRRVVRKGDPDFPELAAKFVSKF